MTSRLRSGSLFKKRQTRAGGYQGWADEEEGDGPFLGDEPTPARPLRSPDSALEEGGRGDVGVEGSAANLSEGLSLVECFYLGCYEMDGPIRGRGCIDTPAGELWERTQEDGGRKRRRSLRGSTKVRGGTAAAEDSAVRPRYVKLVAVKDELEMRDVGSGEKMASFSYSSIPFVGTHPKYNRLFAFVAHAKGCRVPSCYAFKCEDKTSACSTAEQLDGVFHQRCAELSRAHRPSPSPSSSSSLVAAQ